MAENKLELVNFLRENEELVYKTCDAARKKAFGWTGNYLGLQVVLFVDSGDFTFSTDTFGCGDSLAPWSSRVELARFDCDSCSGNCDNCEEGGCGSYDAVGRDFCNLDQICKELERG